MEVIKQKTAKNKLVVALKKGGVIICPTDTVYGFLADATNDKALEKIFKIKQRSKSKTLPIFVKDLKVAKELAEIDARQEKILKKYWPGSYTFVLKNKSISSSFLVKDNTIALRIPKNKFLQDLLKKIDKPLAQTSTNISNGPILRRVSEIKKEFEKENILVVDAGDLEKAQPSKIFDITKGKLKVLRK